MKKLLKKLFWLITLFMFGNSLLSATTEIEERTMVLTVLKQYAKTVACSLDFEDTNVFTIKRDIEYGEATYYALWSGDKGCFGGSGTDNVYVSEIYRSEKSKPFLVMNDKAFGKAFSKINTRFMSHLQIQKSQVANFWLN